MVHILFIIAHFHRFVKSVKAARQRKNPPYRKTGENEFLPHFIPVSGKQQILPYLLQEIPCGLAEYLHSLVDLLVRRC